MRVTLPDPKHDQICALQETADALNRSESTEDWRRAIEIYTKILLMLTPGKNLWIERAMFISARAGVYRRMGSYEAALVDLQECMRIERARENTYTVGVLQKQIDKITKEAKVAASPQHARADDEEAQPKDLGPALKKQIKCYRCGREPSEILKNGEYWCSWCGKEFNPKNVPKPKGAIKSSVQTQTGFLSPDGFLSNQFNHMRSLIMEMDAETKKNRAAIELSEKRDFQDLNKTGITAKIKWIQSSEVNLPLIITPRPITNKKELIDTEISWRFKLFFIMKEAMIFIDINFKILKRRYVFAFTIPDPEYKIFFNTIVNHRLPSIWFNDEPIASTSIAIPILNWRSLINMLIQYNTCIGHSYFKV